MYVIAGATGNTGSVVAETLLAHGKEVRTLGRSAERLKPLADKGAQTYALDLSDTTKLIDALRGAEAAYLLIPPHYGAEQWIAYMDGVADGFVDALKETRTPYVAFLSSIGAQHDEGNGPIKGLHRAEKKLEMLENTNVLSLRDGYFMENLFWGMDAIKEHSVFGSFVTGDVPLPLIATRDIGEYAAKRMVGKDFNGFETQELHGERDVPMTEVAKAIGEAIGKPDLPYQQFPEEAMREPMKAMGASDDAVEMYAEMTRGLNSGHIAPLEERGSENTTPTSIEAFAKVFAQVYSA